MESIEMPNKNIPARASDSITPEQIAQWKREHKTVHELEVDGYKCWLKAPNRETVRYAMQKGATDAIGMAEVLLQECWLGGDTEIGTDDELFMNAALEMQGLITFKTASLKKIL